MDAHSRMRAMLEGNSSDTPRSDLKDTLRPAARPTNYLPDGIDVAAAIRRAAEGYKTAGMPINQEPVKRTPITLTESREDLAARIPDPIQRAYVILSGRA